MIEYRILRKGEIVEILRSYFGQFGQFGQYALLSLPFGALVILEVLFFILIRYMIKREHKAFLVADSFSYPLIFITLVVGVYFPLERMGVLNSETAFTCVLKAVFIAIAWVILRFLKRMELNNAFFKRNVLTLRFINRTVRVLFFIVIAEEVLAMFGMPVTGLLTTGGVVALGLTLGLKDFFTNLVNGFMLQIDSPFKVGDYIVATDQPGISGRIESVGWRVTRIRKDTGDIQMIPNHVLATLILENKKPKSL